MKDCDDMSNISVIFFQPLLKQDYRNLALFYEQVVESLKCYGNNVQILNTYPQYSPIYEYDENTVAGEIALFNPDLIITFNNQISEKIIKLTHCPIVAWCADHLNLWMNKHLLKKYISRYLVLTTKYWMKDFLDFGFKPQQLCHISLFTTLKKENLPQDKNISFIGTSFEVFEKNYRYFDRQKNYKKIYEAYLNFTEHQCPYYKNYFNDDLPRNIDEADLYAFFDQRSLILSSVLDLGLCLYGMNWDKFKYVVPQLFCAWKQKDIYSLKDNQDIYNSSKICISINHPQNKGGSYPWRVMDIMASNGCLVSQYSRQLEEETAGYVNIPMYQSPNEAYSLCKSLLNDDVRRKEIVDASQEFVKEHGDIAKLFSLIEAVSNVKILNSNSGNIAFVEYKKAGKEIEKNGISFKNKLRYKIWKHLGKKLKKKGII